MTFTVFNSVAEEIDTFTSVFVARFSARKRCEQLSGSRHYVRNNDTGVIVFDTRTGKALGIEGETIGIFRYSATVPGSVEIVNTFGHVIATFKPGDLADATGKPFDCSKL